MANVTVKNVTVQARSVVLVVDTEQLLQRVVPLAAGVSVDIAQAVADNSPDLRQQVADGRLIITAGTLGAISNGTSLTSVGDRTAENTDLPVKVTVSAAADVATVDAMTTIAITGGQSPTEAEFNTLVVDVTALNARVGELKTLANDLKAKLNAMNS